MDFGLRQLYFHRHKVGGEWGFGVWQLYFHRDKLGGELRRFLVWFINVEKVIKVVNAKILFLVSGVGNVGISLGDVVQLIL